MQENNDLMEFFNDLFEDEEFEVIKKLYEFDEAEESLDSLINGTKGE